MIREPKKVRLQKYLADCGIGARRKCEEYIRDGRVCLNGYVVTSPGLKINPGKDRVLFDEAEIAPDAKVYFALNKPKGYVCTNIDTHERKKAIDLIKNCNKKIFTVGRLDMESEGLIFVTNDGDLANKISHPARRIEKEYFVSPEPFFRHADVKKALRGITLEDGVFVPLEFVPNKDGSIVRIVVHEGRKRILRRAFRFLGYRVKRLVRTRIGTVRLDGLSPGKSRSLTIKERRSLAGSRGRF